jgi:hypothetical protein
MGAYYSKDKNIETLVRDLIKQGWSAVKSKHWQIYTPDGRWKVAVPMTPSCPRAFMNFKADVRRLQRSN